MGAYSFQLKLLFSIAVVFLVFFFTSFYYYDQLFSFENYEVVDAVEERNVVLTNRFDKDVSVYFRDEQEFGSFLSILQPGDSLEVTAVDGQEFFATNVNSSSSVETLSSVRVREGKMNYNLQTPKSSLRVKASLGRGRRSKGDTGDAGGKDINTNHNNTTRHRFETRGENKKSVKASAYSPTSGRIGSSATLHVNSVKSEKLEKSDRRLGDMPPVIIKRGSDTIVDDRSAPYQYNILKKTATHYSVHDFGTSRSGFAMSAKFRSLSGKPIDLWYDDGGEGTLQAHLKPGQETTTTTYQGHRFYATYVGQKDHSMNNRITTFHIHPNQVFYPIEDLKFPADAKILEHTRKEQSFSEEYLNRTGVHWRHFYGPEGPRPPPKLFMWPADEIGQVHRAVSDQGKWVCEGDKENCQSKDSVVLDLEILSLTPRAFVIENFLSEFECDAIIKLSKDKLHASSVGEAEAGIFNSNTRTSLNTWLSKDTSPTVSTIFNRAADLLRIDRSLMAQSKNTEDLQVVHYNVGQKYDSHHDWGVSGYPESRYITLLLYLNDKQTPNSGGETSFPLGVRPDGRIGFKVRPLKGCAVLFYNLLPDGNADNLALHGALPVSIGEKWLANLWIWDAKMK